MTKEETKKLCESRGLLYKGDFIEQLEESEFNAGLLKFNIPSSDNIESENGEGVWGWTDKESHKKYMDDEYEGEITVVLCNNPLEYFGVLVWGCEVVVRCNGDMRPTLSPDFVREKILPIYENEKEM